MDGGAYARCRPVVLSRGTLHAAGAYAARTCGCAPARWPRTRRPTARSAASARPRPISRRRCRSADRRGPRRFLSLSCDGAGNIGSASRPRDRSCARASARRRSSTESSSGRSTTRRARNTTAGRQRAERSAAVRQGHRDRPVCQHGAGFTGSGEVYLAQPAGVGADAPTGGSSSWSPRRRSVRAPTRSSRRSRPTLWASPLTSELGVGRPALRCPTGADRRVAHGMVVGGLVHRGLSAR